MPLTPESKDSSLSEDLFVNTVVDSPRNRQSRIFIIQERQRRMSRIQKVREVNDQYREAVREEQTGSESSIKICANARKSLLATPPSQNTNSLLPMKPKPADCLSTVVLKKRHTSPKRMSYRKISSISKVFKTAKNEVQNNLSKINDIQSDTEDME